MTANPSVAGSNVERFVAGYPEESYVDEILKGAKPGELQVEQPMKLDLAINRRTARVISLNIMQEMLLRADTWAPGA